MICVFCIFYVYIGVLNIYIFRCLNTMRYYQFEIFYQRSLLHDILKNISSNCTFLHNFPGYDFHICLITFMCIRKLINLHCVFGSDVILFSYLILKEIHGSNCGNVLFYILPLKCVFSPESLKWEVSSMAWQVFSVQLLNATVNKECRETDKYTTL